jgi:hypothetical protein
MEDENDLKEKQLQFISAYQASLAIIKDACEAVGITRQTYYRWIKDNDKFRAACKIVEEEQIDIVESAFMKNVISGDSKSQMFYLRTKGRKRGYVTDEIEVKDPFEGLKYTPREAEYLLEKCGIRVEPERIQTYDVDE